MAKSARSSRTKTNNQALKKKVFGPVEAARNERMHAKLLELAKAPKEEVMKEVEEQPSEQETAQNAAKETPAEQDMELDDTASTKAPKSKREIGRLRAARAERVDKSRRRKPRNQVTFPSHPMKKRKGSKR